VKLLTSHPGELMDYEQAGRGSESAAGSAEAAYRGAHHGRHRFGFHGHVRAGHSVHAGEDRHQPLAVAARHGRGRPAAHHDAAPEVTAASGMDIVCHAPESYTARDYRASARKAPEDRVTYCGSNPVSDLWSEKDPLDDPSEQRPRALTELMRDIDMPNGLHACGFGAGDIDELVEGTPKQQRLLSTCPKDVAEYDIANIFLESLENW